MEINILYVDNHLLLLDKPALMVTQPTTSHPTSLESWGKEWLQKEFHKERAFLEAAHRLDREVSGIVLFARSSKALARLQQMQREGNNFTKVYLGIVEGKLDSPKGRFVDYLIHGDHRAHLASAQDGEAKYAELEYSVLAEKRGKNLVEIHLKTGRYHQIRIQFASRGYPILGDKKYGSTTHYSPGIALHHYRLTFPHPVQEKRMEVDSSPPAAFLSLFR